MPIEVTDNAFKRVNELIKQNKNPDLVFKIEVNGGGCSGFSYNFALVPSCNIAEDDIVVRRDGVAVIIDSLSQQYMTDSVLDFIEELGNSYFEIRNPKAKTRCGCGNSFSI